MKNLLRCGMIKETICMISYGKNSKQGALRMKSVQTKILVLILSCILLSAGLFGGAGYYNARTVVESDSAQIMNLICSLKAQEMNAPLRNIEQSVNILYHYIDNQIDLERLETNENYAYRFLEKMEEVSLNTAKNTEGSIAIYFRLNPEITAPLAGVFLVRDEKTGEYFEHEITPLEEYAPGDAEHVGWYYQPIENKKATWLEPYYNANLKKKMISYIIPIFKGRETIGVVGMDIDLSLLKKTVNSVAVYDSGYAFLISPKGDIVYHKDYPNGMTQEKFENSLADIKYILSKPQPGEKMYEYNWNGQPRKMVLKKLINEMKIGVTVPSEKIDEPKNKLISQVVLSLIVIMAIAIVLTVHLSKMVVRPLKQLTEAAGKISEGDLSVAIECKTKDEVGVLAESFKRTAKHLKQYIDYINHLAYTDALTDAQNKTAYTDRTNRLDLEIKEGGAKFAVVVLDLNNLKKMNDTYGHEYGDMLIVDAAGIIQKSFGRLSVYRIGGDEFSVILTDENYENYQKLLQKFKEEIVRFNAENKKYQTELQIACGVAVYIEGKDKNFGDVFRRGDKEMYENKKMLKQKAREAE